MSEQETSQDPPYMPPKRSSRDPRTSRAGRAAAAPQSPSKVSPKTGRVMEMRTGKVLQAEGGKAPAAADKAAEAQADKQNLQREKRSPPTKRGPGRPPNPKLGAPGTWGCVPTLACHRALSLLGAAPYVWSMCAATACKQSCVTQFRSVRAATSHHRWPTSCACMQARSQQLQHQRRPWSMLKPRCVPGPRSRFEPSCVCLIPLPTGLHVCLCQ